jgi:hypothetical protein
MSISVIPDRDGAWVAVVAGETVLVIEAQAAAGIAPLHAALRSDDPTRAALGLLLAARGLDELPAFALVWLAGAGTEAQATVRVVLRGPLTVTSGSEVLSGSDVETWTERSVHAERELRISTPAEASGAALPLVDGAAWAAQVTVEIAAAASPAVVPTLAAAATPDSAPGAAAAIDERTMAEPQDDLLGYDELFGATVIRSVEAAAVRPLAASEEVDPPATHDAGSSDSDNDDHDDDDDDGDHDGLTVFSDQLGDVRGRVRPHPSEIAAADAPASFWIRMPDGNREPLIGEVLVGRAPTTRVGDGPVPRLVTLTGDPDISRTHVKFALEGDTVVVTDLHSRNGTTVVLPGKPPQLLRTGESATVIADTVVDLGGGTEMTVEQDAS